MRYLVLRADADLEAGVDFANPRAWRETTRAASELQLEVVDGHEADAGDLRDDPKNAAVLDADAIFTLVEPKDSADALLDALRPAGQLKMPHGLIAVGAHTSPFDGQGVGVAVLDTGADVNHPAFTGKQLVTRDFTGEGADEADVTDNNGHGTHCAGTVCGGVVGDIRVGVAPGVTKLCVGKVLGQQGGSLEALLGALHWAVFEQKAQVVSMSLGYDLPGNANRLIQRFNVDPRLATEMALRQQNDIIKGIGTLRAFLQSQSPNAIFVAATGNESSRPGFVLDAGLPASELIGIGAVGFAGDKWDVAPFSNGRAKLVAPGVDVISAAPGGGWASMSGTSMATPHAAGVAALWAQKLRNEGALSVPDVLGSELVSRATSSMLISASDRSAVGRGMVQAPQ